MPDRRSTLLFDSRLVRVFGVDCDAPRSRRGEPECPLATQIVVPRRGVFVLHQRGTATVADSTSAVVLPTLHEYWVSHPTSGGDACTVLVFTPALLEDAFGADGWRHGRLRPSTKLGLALLTAGLGGDAVDGLEGEEASVLLLEALARDLVTPAAPPRLGPLPRRRAEQVRALLASRPGTHWRLDTLARAVSCSPFHLARQFRMATGETIGRYLLRLRLAMALERIADGERNLASLALELGFAHHSHFSARFREIFGVTPTRARDAITRRRMDEMRTIVTAGLDGRS